MHAMRQLIGRALPTPRKCECSTASRDKCCGSRSQKDEQYLRTSEASTARAARGFPREPAHRGAESHAGLMPRGHFRDDFRLRLEPFEPDLRFQELRAGLVRVALLHRVGELLVPSQQAVAGQRARGLAASSLPSPPRGPRRKRSARGPRSDRRVACGALPVPRASSGPAVSLWCTSHRTTTDIENPGWARGLVVGWPDAR